MSDAPLQINVDDADVRAELARLAARLTDLTPAMRGIGAELEARISARFEAEEDPTGAAWAEWSESYAEQRSNRYPDANESILDRYGDMLDSLSYDATRDSVTIGFGQPYAAYHEYGTVHMPPRGLLTADPDAGGGPTLGRGDAEAVLDVLQAVLER